MLFSLFFVSMLVFTCHASNNVTLCSDLTCMRHPSGQLVHYDIYERPDWIKIPVWICAREVTHCSFSSNFLATHTRRCATTFVELSRETCLMVAASKDSVDGKLKQSSVNFWATNNAVHEKYKWWSTTSITKSNTFLEAEQADSNGTVVETTHPILSTCYHKKGVCALLNKTMAWETPCFNNLQYQRSEVCHHLRKFVYCSDSDFDEIRREDICGSSYVRTQQGVYLGMNTSLQVNKVKEHKLNAAVIQHLLNEVDILRHMLLCLSYNAYCSHLRENVSEEHHVIHRFFHNHKTTSPRDIDLNALIKEKIQEIQGQQSPFMTSNTHASWLATILSRTEHFLLTLFVFGLFIALLICLVPKLFLYLLKCSRRRRRYTEPSVSAPMELQELPEAHPLNRYRSYSVRARRPNSGINLN